MTDTASAAPSEQDLFERVFPMPEGCMRCGDTYAPTEYSAWAVSAFIERFKGWQAARRAQPTPPAVVEPMTDEQIKDEASYHGFIGSTEQLIKFARAIERAHGIGNGETHARRTDALILQLVEALEYHRAQTRPIELTDEAITAGRARLEGKP